MLRARRLDDPVLLIGSDELADFPTWKEPEAVLELARLAVAARPGFAVADPPPGVTFFEIEPIPGQLDGGPPPRRRRRADRRARAARRGR